MDERTATIVGVLLNSALYLVCCFLAGIATHNGWAWRLAIAAMGVTYLSYLTQLQPDDKGFGPPVVWLSIVLGAAAGLALLF